MSRSESRHPVRGVVFDLDGTLVDAFPGLTTAANAARAAVGLPPLTQEAVTRMVGGGVERLVAQAVGTDRVRDALPVFRDTYARVCEEQTLPLPDAQPTLAALAVAGIRTAVASNKAVEYSERILVRLSLRSMIGVLEGPETAGALKPDPAMIHRCLAQLGLGAEEAIYVGDMPIDWTAGRAAGVRVALVSGGAARDDDLLRTGAPVLRRLYDLAAMLGLESEGENPR